MEASMGRGPARKREGRLGISPAEVVDLRLDEFQDVSVEFLRLQLGEAM